LELVEAQAQGPASKILLLVCKFKAAKLKRAYMCFMFAAEIFYVLEALHHVR
jgi:hypothetical protein